MEPRSDAGGGVTALQLTNARSEAIRFYREYRSLLYRELGLEPSRLMNQLIPSLHRR